MKKQFILICFLFVSFTVINFSMKTVSAKQSNSLMDLVVKNDDFYYEDQEMIVVGNNYTLNQKCLSDLTSNLENRVLLVYFTDLDRAPNDFYIYDNHATIYRINQGLLIRSTYVSKSINKDELINEIADYFLEKHTSPIENYTLNSASLFNIIQYEDGRIDGKPYGYIDYTVTLRQYNASTNSSLYIVETNVSFTPGYVALNNGSKGFDKYKNSSGYVHVLAKPVIEIDEDLVPRIGGTPVLKDYYPINQPGTVTIGSSFTFGLNLGYSFKNGFSEEDTTHEVNMGANIAYSYSKSYTNPEPALTTQRDADNFNKYQWFYSYTSFKTETNHLYTGYMFEMNNRGHDFLPGDVILSLNFKMTVAKVVIFHFYETVSDTKTLNFY